MLEMEAAPSMRHPAVSDPLIGLSGLSGPCPPRSRRPVEEDQAGAAEELPTSLLPASVPAAHGLLDSLSGWLHSLRDPATGDDISDSWADHELVDLMRVLEELKSAAAAVQARAAAVFDASQRRAQARAGVPAALLGRGVGAQVALARRDSPHRGSRHLGFGKALVHEMPHTLAALSSGVLSEWRATLLVRETACLDVEDRHRVDELICADPSSLEGVGDRKLIARIRSITQSIDPASQVRRNAKAVADRYVSCRPAPDTMCYLTGLLPVAQGVAVYAALSRAADSLRATGDERGRGQIMADTLVERVTGQTTADQVPVEVQLVITDRTLLTNLLFPNDGVQDGKQCRGRDLGQIREEDQVRGREGRLSAAPVAPDTPAAQPDTPAYFPGYGIVPGAWARELIRNALGTEPAHAEQLSLVSLRRLFMDPVSGELTAMESKARAFPAGLARLIRTRDQTCRTPWCDAPIRHIDHVQPHAEGGPTSYTNGQGLCEACNHSKQAPGWIATPTSRTGTSGAPARSEAAGAATAPRPAPAGPKNRHTVRITTPTGHSYTSIAPPVAVPGAGPRSMAGPAPGPVPGPAPGRVPVPAPMQVPGRP